MKVHRKQGLIRGTGTHRRTESDYMGALLDTVTIDDWREVIAATLELAKQGDSAAREWLARYLVGRPEARAPTPLTVVVQQWSGTDPVVERLAKPLIDRAQFPTLHEDDDLEETVRAAIAGELAEKLAAPATASDSGKSAE